MPTVADGSFMVLDRDHTEPRRINSIYVFLVMISGVGIAVAGKTQVCRRGFCPSSSGNTFSVLQLQLCAAQLDGKIAHFAKPWILTISYFMGMACCIVPFLLKKVFVQLRLQFLMLFSDTAREGAFLERGPSFFVNISFSSLLRLVMPATIELVATLFTSVGLLWMSVRSRFLLRVRSFLILSLPLAGKRPSGTSLLTFGFQRLDCARLLQANSFLISLGWPCPLRHRYISPLSKKCCSKI